MAIKILHLDSDPVKVTVCKTDKELLDFANLILTEDGEQKEFKGKAISYLFQYSEDLIVFTQTDEDLLEELSYMANKEKAGTLPPKDAMRYVHIYDVLSLTGVEIPFGVEV